MRDIIIFIINNLSDLVFNINTGEIRVLFYDIL